ncbi:hypothetical protein BH23THE1_BH23THE1_23580 [soil metagenome]
MQRLIVFLTLSILLFSSINYLTLNLNVYAQGSNGGEKWTKFVLMDIGLDIEYPSDWIVDENNERTRDLMRVYTPDPSPIVSFDSEEKTSNEPPELGIEMPETLVETFENIPAASFTIFTPNEKGSSSNNTMENSMRGLLYSEIYTELNKRFNQNTVNTIEGENIILSGLNQTVWKVDNVDKLGDQERTKDSYLFFYNNGTSSFIEIKYSSDASAGDEYGSIFTHMLNSIKPLASTIENDSDEDR